MSTALFVLAAGLAATGCATTSPELKHGLGVGEWQARLPTSRSPIDEMAFGRGGSSLANSDALAGLDANTPDDVLRPSVTDVTFASKVAPKPVAHRISKAAPQPAAAVTPEPAHTVTVETAAAPVELAARAANDVDARYSQREVQAQEQQKFRGGDAIVISAGAVVVVLLIVILILLLR